MATVSLAAIKFGEVILEWEGWQTLLIACTITLIYSTLGGLKAVIITDFVQFVMAMTGSIVAAIYIINLPEIGGLSELLNHENVIGKISLLPDLSDPNIWIPVMLVPIAVQWWASYYPGAEPGGGGYIAQRMFSAKDENNAIGATFLLTLRIMLYVHGHGYSLHYPLWYYFLSFLIFKGHSQTYLKINLAMMSHTPLCLPFFLQGCWV